MGPGYISDMLSVATNGYHHTRSVSREALSVPRISSKLGERAFSVNAPKLWNSLPDSIRKSNSLLNFKKSSKTHFYRIHFYYVQVMFTYHVQRY